jgi:Fe-S-cluster containining protein
MARHLGGRCKALKGEVGVSCSCAIYDRRPKVCAQFEPNSEGCLEARTRMKYKLARPEHKYRGYGPDWQKTV